MWYMNGGRIGLFLVAMGVLLFAACAGAPGGSTLPSPSPSPTGSPLSQAELKYVLLSEFGPISWCDPDFYPVAHQDEQVSATEHWAQIVADRATFLAITAHLGLDAAADLSPAEQLAVYHDWKLLNAVALTTLEDGAYGFDLITETDPGLGRGVHTVGTIDGAGAITIATQEDSFLTACPICLARGTLIDTPGGPRAVDELRVGDEVWTVDATGARVAGSILRVGSTPVPASHRVVHLVLADGREMYVSPGHRLADGRAVGDLAVDDQVDGARVLTSELVAYAGGRTFDVLPDGPTGYYWASGILLASTLH